MIQRFWQKAYFDFRDVLLGVKALIKSLYLAKCRIPCFVLLFGLFNLFDKEITVKYVFSVVYLLLALHLYWNVL